MTLPPDDRPHPSTAFPARSMPVRVLPPVRMPEAAAPKERGRPSTPTPSPTQAPALPGREQRSDIQGLRALAVVAVILNHLIGWPKGGFVGVDVFFVVSGFLITGLLLRSGERDGGAALPRFYARRVRRILPGAVVVLAVTTAAAYLLFAPVRAASVLGDALSALLLFANWHFAAVGTDYFHALGAPSPLQHFWSLSVEEQFYLVWPAVIVIALAVAGRRGRTAVGVIAIVIVVASFAWALVETHDQPTVAYFSTLSRAWELGVGAAIAAIAPVLSRLPTAVRPVLGWFGLAVIVVSFFIVDDTVAFPGPWAALPVAATALVVIAGTGGTQRGLIALQNPVSVFLGDISYSLYLWHAPAIAFLLVLVPTQSALTTALVGVIILVLATATYFAVERPVHRSPLFESFPDDEARHAAWDAWRGRVGTQAIGGLIGIGAVVAGIVVLTGSPVGAANPLAAAQQTEASSGSLQSELRAAVKATAWPVLSPSLNDAMATGTLDNPARPCFDLGAMPSAGACTWGLASAPHHMYLIGDSTALAYAPAFKAIAESSGGTWRITTVGLFGCRFTQVLVSSDDQDAVDQCAARKDAIVRMITSDSPDLVVVSNDFTEARSADGGAPLSVAALVASAEQETALLHATHKIVYLAPPPLGADLSQCYSAVSTPQSCTSDVDGTWSAFAAETKRVATADHDHFVTSLPFSCVDGRCPPFAGSIPTRFDAVHMTTAYAVHVAPVIRQEFAAQKLL